MSGEGRIIVKARGLPWSASADEVVEFFSEVAIVGGVEGVHFGKNREGRQENLAWNGCKMAISQSTYFWDTL